MTNRNRNNAMDYKSGPNRRAGGSLVSAALPKLRDSLIAAIEGDAYGKLDRSWKEPDHGRHNASVAVVSEARRLDKLNMSFEAICEALDGHGARYTEGQVRRWLLGVTAIKGYPVVRATDEPYLITPPETFEMNKRVAKLKKMIEEAGLVFEKFIDKHDGRITCVANAGTDETRIFSITTKEGDRHGDLNEASRMRRFARECGSPATQLAEKLKPLVEEFKNVAKVAPPEEDASPVQQDPYLEGITKKWVETTPELPQEIAPETKTAENGLLTSINSPPLVESKAASAPTVFKPSISKPRQDMTTASKSTAAKKAIFRMTMENSFKLIAWMKTLDVSKYASIKALHIDANKELGIQIPYSTLQDAMRVAEITIAVPEKRTYMRSAPILARAILRIYKELGVEPDAELNRIASESS